MKILLVDDSDPIQRVMRHILVKEGFDVSIAADGRQAVAMALQSMRVGRCFDLVFMDLEMPTMNGYDTYQRMRKRGYKGPIVALTACNTLKDHKKCQEIGFDHFAEKPINKTNLLSIITHLTQKTQVHAENMDPS